MRAVTHKRTCGCAVIFCCM